MSDKPGRVLVLPLQQPRAPCYSGRWPFVFGVFPRWGRWQDFRCWRHTVAYPAVKAPLRRG